CYSLVLMFFFSSRRRHTRFSRDWSSDVCSSDLLALGTALQQVSPVVIRSRAAAALRVDVAGLLPSVTLPVLQLVASQDRLLTKALSAGLGKSLPNCRTVIVPGPHLLLQASSELCAKEVAAFALGLGPNNSFKPTPLRGAA